MGITQIFSQFYDDVPPSQRPDIGSVYWVPTPEVSEVPLILQVKRASPEEHEIIDFEFVQVGSQHFKSGTRLPIKRLNLGDTEELMVAKAKKRPCVVLGRGFLAPEQIASLPKGEQQKLAKHLERIVYLVAPMYGCSTYYKQNAFGPVLTARVKALWYQHLCYMPDFNGQEPGSILRLDHVFATHLGRGSEPAGKKVKEDVFQIVQAQFLVTCGLPPDDLLLAAKDLVNGCLPAELR